MDEKTDFISLPFNKKNYNDINEILIKINEIKKDIISLTLPQRYCLLLYPVHIYLINLLFSKEKQIQVKII